MKKENLGSGYMGNGITYWDRGREKNHDYLIIAHVAEDGTISYRDENLPNDVKAIIEADSERIKKEGLGVFRPKYEDGGELWIQRAIHHEGALRKKAKEMGLIKGDEKLTKSDLDKLEALGGVWQRRATLAKTLSKFEEGGLADSNEYVEALREYDRLGAELDDRKEEGADESVLAELRGRIEALESKIHDYERPMYEQGGEITSPKQWLESLNLSVLPEKARKYVEQDILTDADLNMIAMDDDVFVEVKNIIESEYPQALPIKVVESVVVELTKEQREAQLETKIAGFKILERRAKTKEDKDNIKTKIEGFTLLLKRLKAKK